MRTTTLLTLSSLVLTVAQPALAAFRDVSSTHMHADAIAYVQSQSIVSGYADGTFRADVVINRAEFTKIIVGSLHSLTAIRDALKKVTARRLADVPVSAWFTEYVNFAVSEGIVSGYSDGTFKPERQINVAEAAKILALAYDLPVTQGSVWYEGYLRALATAKAIPTDIQRLDAPLTRGQMAEMVYRLRAKVKTKASLTYEQLAGLPAQTSSSRASSAASQGTYNPTYIAFTDAALTSGRPALLFFHASWCPSCKQHDSALKEWYEHEKPFLTTYKVDYDTSASLKTKYKVTSQHTFILIDGSGNAILTMNGPSDDDLRDVLGLE